MSARSGPAGTRGDDPQSRSGDPDQDKKNQERIKTYRSTIGPRNAILTTQNETNKMTEVLEYRGIKKDWGLRDSNPEPRDYESPYSQAESPRNSRENACLGTVLYHRLYPS